MALQDLNMMPLSRLDCPLSLKTPNMGNIGLTVARVVLSNYVDKKSTVELDADATTPVATFIVGIVNGAYACPSVPQISAIPELLGMVVLGEIRMYPAVRHGVVKTGRWSLDEYVLAD